LDGVFIPSPGAKEDWTTRDPASPLWPEILCLGATTTLLLQPLAVFWTQQPDYAFGWGVPFLALYLGSQGWRTRPAQKLFPFDGRMIAAFATWSALLLLARLLEGTVPDWRPALWLSAVLDVGGILGWCWWRGGFAWIKHFAFPAGFLFFAVPWPYQFESWAVQGLMRGNALLVANSLALADIPARAAGNTIALTSVTLGVEQACSGIHSLQASLMMSFFLGEFYHLSWSRRGLLVLLGFLFALLGNYLRLLFLAATAATCGIVSMSKAHDVAAGEILMPTLAGLWIVAFLFRCRDEGPSLLPPRQVVRETEPARSAAGIWAAGILCAAITSEVIVQEWFAWHERSTLQTRVWQIRLPVDEARFHLLPVPAATHQLLGDSYSEAGAWVDANGWPWQLYYFRYAAQHANRISLDLHNPEVCLPAAGQRELARFPEFLWSQRGVRLTVETYLFTAPGGPRYVFWIVDDEGFRSGHAPGFIYGEGVRAFGQRFFLWMQEAARGIRFSSRQSLEVTIFGPGDFPAARRAVEEFLARSLR
jgi:exosortase